MILAVGLSPSYALAKPYHRQGAQESLLTKLARADGVCLGGTLNKGVPKDYVALGDYPRGKSRAHASYYKICGDLAIPYVVGRPSR